jgi:hypothetical protein
MHPAENRWAFPDVFYAYAPGIFGIFKIVSSRRE